MTKRKLLEAAVFLAIAALLFFMASQREPAAPLAATATPLPSQLDVRTELERLTIAPRAAGPTPYNRAEWHAWIDADHDCQDTRAEVLITESGTQVQFADARHCRVASGMWLDPYTGHWVARASEMDIDHLVPLENAYASGAWSWDSARKTAYANDLADYGQLLAVSASQNRSKGSSGPEDWRPPRTEFWCEYATDWVGVKQRWNLTVTPSERAALEAMIAPCPVAIPR